MSEREKKCAMNICFFVFEKYSTDYINGSFVLIFAKNFSQ